MLGDKRFIRTLRLRNLLSFGPDTPPIELGSLNVLIGPNGSGKSNISDILVDALSHVPQALLVCEKENNATSVRRLDQDALRKWLENYTLGDLWRSGQLGGNRW